jgi:hypothetical protein
MRTICDARAALAADPFGCSRRSWRKAHQNCAFYDATGIEFWPKRKE